MWAVSRAALRVSHLVVQRVAQKAVQWVDLWVGCSAVPMVFRSVVQWAGLRVDCLAAVTVDWMDVQLAVPWVDLRVASWAGGRVVLTEER